MGVTCQIFWQDRSLGTLRLGVWESIFTSFLCPSIWDWLASLWVYFSISILSGTLAMFLVSLNYRTTPSICSLMLSAKTAFKIWNFYFSQILTGIVEKQHVLTPFNFFCTLSHCLALFSIFSVDINWIIFYVTATFLNFTIDKYYAKFVV